MPPDEDAIEQSEWVNETQLFLSGLLCEWQDNPDLDDDTEVAGITQGHLRRAHYLLFGRTIKRGFDEQ